MPSQETINALEVLRLELEKLQPAIKHVEMAQQVTEIVKGIPQKHVDLLEEIKGNDTAHKSNLREIFNDELGKLTGENRKLQEFTTGIQQQVVEMANGLPQKHTDLIRQVHENDSNHKNELKNLFETELSTVTEENKKLQKNTAEIQLEIKADLEALIKLKNTIQTFYEKIEKISFPERLDKLDANIAGAMAAIQSIQSRLDSLERNIIDRLRDLTDFQKETKSEILSSLSHSETIINERIRVMSKKQHLLSYIILLLCGTLVVLYLVNKLKP